MSKHTEGEWTLMTDENGKSIWIKVRTPDGLLSHIARFDQRWICEEHGGEAEANARLITAAPAMLSALQRAVEASEADSDDYDWIGEAMAAIEKATGERLDAIDRDVLESQP